MIAVVVATNDDYCPNFPGEPEQRINPMKPIVSMLAISIVLSGCAVDSNHRTDAETDSNDDVMALVNPGDSTQEVLAKLKPAYDLAAKVRYLKDPEEHATESSVVDIYYMKPVRPTDDSSSDDKITLYMFIDDKLAGIGWAASDDPKIQALQKEEPH
jgi:hypothetical protein